MPFKWFVITCEMIRSDLYGITRGVRNVHGHSLNVLQLGLGISGTSAHILARPGAESYLSVRIFEKVIQDKATVICGVGVEPTSSTWMRRGLR